MLLKPFQILFVVKRQSQMASFFIQFFKYLLSAISVYTRTWFGNETPREINSYSHQAIAQCNGSEKQT